MSTYPTQPEIWYRPIPPNYTELLHIVQELQRRVAALETAAHNQPQTDSAAQNAPDVILYLAAQDRPF